MNCKCGSNRIISVSGKCSDMFFARQLDTNEEYEGYVPFEIGLEGGDYLALKYCLECGQIQNWKGPALGLGHEDE